MENKAEAFLCASLVLLFLSVFSIPVHARSVTMNLAFNITDKDNIIHVNDTDFSGTGGTLLTSGPNNPSVGENIDAGVVNWSSPGNVTSSNNNYATAGLKNVNYTGFNFSTEGNAPRDVTFNGTFFYTIDSGTAKVHEYNRTGSYTGFQFSVSSEELVPTGLTFNGSRFYIVGLNDDAVFEYTSAGVYTGFSFSTFPNENSLNAVTFNGTHFHVIGSLRTAVFEYNRTGSYTGFSFSVAGQDTNPIGLAFDGAYFYVVGGATDTIYEYDINGAYTGFSYNFSAQESFPTGGTFFNGTFYVVGLGTVRVHEYKSVNETSDGLRASNFGFGVPSNATINGIKIEVERKASGSGIKDNSVRLVKNGSAVGDDKASADEWPTTDAVKTYGGQSDLWGTTWTPADINATNFGAQLEVNSSRFNRTASVDHVKITVYYTLPAPPSLTFTALGKKYISAEKNSTLLGLVFAGSEFLSAHFDTLYSTGHYLLQMKQDDNDNRFLLAFTNGTWRNIDDKAQSVEATKLLSRIFGDMIFSAPSSFNFFMRLENKLVDIANSIRFDGSTKLLIKNKGKANSIHNVTIDLIG